jgi:hypothetical protein
MDDATVPAINTRGVVELLEINGQVLTVDTSKIIQFSSPADYVTRDNGDGTARHELTGDGELRLRVDDYAAIQWRARES